jgi:ribose 5-phosphate isomerase A
MANAAPNLSALAEEALKLIRDGMVVGLGSGKASTAFIERLGECVIGGLKIQGVPTSQASADLATKLGIPLVTLDQVESIDITCDGADEVDPQGNCIKGYGGALVREKVVAAASKRLVILVGSEKLVERLGERGKLPVEVVPFAASFCQRKLASLGLRPEVRRQGSSDYRTDNGNLILDCGTGPIADVGWLDRAIRSIPGIVGTGLFIGMADTVLVQNGKFVNQRDFHATFDYNDLNR